MINTSFLLIKVFHLFSIPTTVSPPFSLPHCFPMPPNYPLPYPPLLHLCPEKSKSPVGVNKACHQFEAEPSFFPHIKAGWGNPAWGIGSPKPTKHQGQVLIPLIGASGTDKATELSHTTIGPSWRSRVHELSHKLRSAGSAGFFIIAMGVKDEYNFELCSNLLWKKFTHQVDEPWNNC